jgi:hypothetical protein
LGRYLLQTVLAPTHSRLLWPVRIVGRMELRIGWHCLATWGSYRCLSCWRSRPASGRTTAFCPAAAVGHRIKITDLLLATFAAIFSKKEARMPTLFIILAVWPPVFYSSASQRP